MHIAEKYLFMASRPIFVSDLDGTLLQPNATLSPFARTTLSRLLEQGVAFTIATARNIVSIRQIIQDLPLKLPVVCSNGAYLCDWQSDRRYGIKAIPADLAAHVLADIKGLGFDPFCASFTEAEDHLYIASNCRTGAGWYRDDRLQHQDPRLRLVPAVEVALDEYLISINTIHPAAEIDTLEAFLRQKYGAQIRLYSYQHWSFSDWTWLSIYHPKATKGAALAQLLENEAYDAAHLTVFGDEMNDLSMFKMAGTAVAMSHARAELKAIAHQEIGTNEADSVVNYILRTTAH